MKANTIQSMSFARETLNCQGYWANQNDVLHYLDNRTATLTGGNLTGSITDESFQMIVPTDDGDNGRRVGLRLGLDDVQIDDFIDLSARHQHMFKVDMEIDVDGTTNTSDASLEVYAGATTWDEDSEFSTRSATYKNSWTFAHLLTQQSLTSFGDNVPFVSLNTWNEGNWLYDQPSSWDSNFVHAGGSEDNWVNWNMPNMYSAYMWLFHTTGGYYPFQAAFKFYETRLYMQCEVENLTKSPFYITCGGRMTNEGNVMTNPAVIIQDIIQKELNLGDLVVANEISKAQQATHNYKLGFSTHKTINSKKLIENICSNTPIFPRIKDQAKLGFAVLLNEYSGSDIDYIINNKDIVSYSVSRTKLELVKSKVNVLYEKDYAEDSKYFKNTGWLSAKDVFGDGDLGYDNGYSNKFYNNDYNNDKEEDTSMTFKSDFITDTDTAKALRTFLCMWYCNQHNIFKLKTNLRYMHLEVGDIVKFDKMLGNQRLYGEDYTIENRRNGQLIYPYFLIQSITKSSNEVSLELIQLHKLSLDNEFQAEIGDIDRNGVVDIDDFDLISDYVQNKGDHYTEKQILSMDINGDSTISYADVLLFAEQLGIDIEEE